MSQLLDTLRDVLITIRKVLAFDEARALSWVFSFSPSPKHMKQIIM